MIYNVVLISAIQHSELVMSVLVAQCPTLCDPMDYSRPGFSVHGILQERILEWIAIPFSRGSSRPRALLEKDLSDRQPRHFPLAQNQKPQGTGSKGILEGIIPIRNNLCSLPFIL